METCVGFVEGIDKFASLLEEVHKSRVQALEAGSLHRYVSIIELSTKIKYLVIASFQIKQITFYLRLATILGSCLFEFWQSVNTKTNGYLGHEKYAPF